jgi:thioredoxin 1
MLDFTDTNFEKEVLEASKTKPVLVDFYATWCGVCKMMAPIFDEVAAENGDKVIFGKANAEDVPVSSEKFDVLSLPTFSVFKDGKLEKSISGPQAKEMLLELLK